VSRFIDELKRTHRCGDLRASDIGKEVVLFGWVASRRDHGGCVFIDLRDREGVAQLVFDPAYAQAETWESRGRSPAPVLDTAQIQEAHRLAEQVRGEWVIGVRGVVVSRGQNKNPKLPTGEVEVIVIEAAVFNRAETPPFEITDEIDTREEIRLTYRYLDLRRAPLQRTLRARHEINRVTRNYLSDQGCLELETPFLVKYTPGGARSSTSSSSWSRASIATSRSSSASATRISGSTGSPSSPRSTSSCPSATRTTSSR
jgi:aspartyl-tRNA synthetase